jgi:hypothetical protein
MRMRHISDHIMTCRYHRACKYDNGQVVENSPSEQNNKEMDTHLPDIQCRVQAVFMHSTAGLARKASE